MKTLACRFRVIPLLAVFIATSCFAMPAGNPPGNSANRSPTADHRLTQYDSNFEAGQAFIKADRELNVLYAAVLKKHATDISFVTKFKAAQRAWLVFRDAEVAAQFPAADTRGTYGSVYPMCVSSLKTELTLRRIEQMKQWRDGAPEGDVCAGSAPTIGDAD